MLPIMNSEEMSLEERPREERAGVMRRGAGACVHAACSQLGLVVLVVLYVLLGAVLFEYLESGPELQKRSVIQRSREECLKELWAITERLNVLYERNWTRLVHEQLRKFETSIVSAARQAGSEVQAAELTVDSQWSFTGALLYCLTLITTVGYGNVSPRTAAGRAATVAYAAAGVPLALACLAGLGASLARLARAAWLKAARRKVPPAAWRKEGELDNHFQLHEHQRLLHYGSETHNQYTAFPPSSSAHANAHANTNAHAQHIVHAARAGSAGAERAQYSQVFERAPNSPRAQTLGRAKRSALAGDEPHPSPALQTQTLGRKCPMVQAGQQCHLATVHTNHPRPKSKFQPRPMTPEVRQLIAEECGELASSSKSQDDLDDTDELEGDGIGVHGTPSRVPLIWKSAEDSRKPATKSCAVPSSSSAATGIHQDDSLEHCHVPASLVILLLTCYICAGAVMFSAWEDWSFLDAAYFCFIALATIGFGDFVPTSFVVSKSNPESTRSEYLQLFACCAYLVFGLILIAMAFSLLQDEVVAKCSQIANTLGLTKQ